jgi:hypothetical protein
MVLNSSSQLHEAAVADQLRIPSDGTVGSVETAVDNYFRLLPAEPQWLELDLSACEYIEVSSLIYFIALIKSRLNRGLHTSLRVPSSEMVRDFLRAWEFPRALRQATGVPFHKLVVEEDRHYFGERQNSQDVRYTGWVLDRQVDRLLSDRFFAITTFPINRSTSHARIVLDETQRWEAQLVKSVLKKHLIGPEGYFANRVIFESMTNALRHPSANIIQTGSRFDIRYDQDGKPSGLKYFTMAFWDDGESIITTLKRAIEGGLKVRSADVPDLYRTYRVILESTDGVKKEPEYVRSNYLPDCATIDELLLLSATFPGITRDVVGEDHLPPVNLTDTEKSLMLPGMGLYVLTNCVVDIFGGTLAFRTKEFFMNIKRTSEWSKKRGDNSDYHVKIKRFSRQTPSFLGNMLTIRLPLRDPNASG